MAMASASSGDDTGMIPSTGPKISSRAMVISFVTPSKTVGAMNWPGPATSPPTISWAPSKQPLLIYPITCALCSGVIIDPMVVSGSSGSPSLKAATRFKILSMKSSTNDLAIICRILAEQFWPPFQKAAIAACSIRSSLIAASSRTMNGLFPPISRPTLFRLLSPE